MGAPNGPYGHRKGPWLGFTGLVVGNRCPGRSGTGGRPAAPRVMRDGGGQPPSPLREERRLDRPDERLLERELDRDALLLRRELDREALLLRRELDREALLSLRRELDREALLPLRRELGREARLSERDRRLGAARDSVRELRVRTDRSPDRVRGERGSTLRLRVWRASWLRVLRS